MSEVVGSSGNDLTITIPSAGERDWATSIRDNCFALISTHNHEGSGTGKKLRGYLALDLTVALVTNDTSIFSVDNAGSSTVALIKASTSDEVVLPTTVAIAEFQDDGLTIVDNADNAKKIAFDATNITTANTRTLTMADADVDLAALTDSNIASGAAIALSKLAATTASRALVSDGSGFVSASAVTSTELGYVSGVTSAIQTQLNTKTDTGTTDEITLTGTTIGLADNPVIPGTASVTVPIGTEAQRAGSPVNGMLRYNSDSSQFEGYAADAWGQIGGGGGGLDSVNTQDFETSVDAGTVTTGNNATFDGGGTLDGSVSDETTNPISGTTTLKYTASTSSTNDYVNIETITLDDKAKGEFLGVTLYADMSNFSANVDFVVKTDEGDILTFTNTDILVGGEAKARYAFNVFVPSTASSLEYGIHMINAPVNTETLLIDDIEFTLSPFVYKNLTDTEFAHFGVRTGWGSTNNKIPYFTNEIKNTTGGIVTIANDSTNGFSITANKKCTVTASISSGQATGTNILGFSLNSSELTTTIQSITAADRVALSGNGSGSINTAQNPTVLIELNTGDVLRPHGDGNALAASGMVLTLKAESTAEHVITPAKSNMTDWTVVQGITIEGTTTDPTKATNLEVDKIEYRQAGDVGEFTYTYRTDSTATSSAAGSGDYLFTLPNGLSFADSVELYTGSIGSTSANDISWRRIGYADGTKDAVTNFQTGGIIPYDATRFRISYGDTSGNHRFIGSGALPLTDVNTGWVIRFALPIDGWDNNVTFLAAIPTNVQNNATDYTTESGITIEGTTSDPTKPTTMDKDEIIWARAGQNLKATYKYYASSLTGSAAGSGDYLFTLPNSLSFDSNVVDYYTTVEGTGDFAFGEGTKVGTVSVVDSGTNVYQGDVIAYDTTRFRLFVSGTTNSGVVGSGHCPTTAWNNYAIQIDAPIAGWTSAGTFLSATPVNKVAYIKDVKASGTDGGTSTLGSYQTRTLNTVEGDTEIVSLSSNQFTLGAGKYEIEAYVPGASLQYHKAKLRNITDSSDALIGTSEYADPTYLGYNSSKIIGEIDISASKTFEVQHRSSATISTFGFGRATTFGDSEVYTVVKITKLPSA